MKNGPEGKCLPDILDLLLFKVADSGSMMQFLQLVSHPWAKKLVFLKI